MTAITLVKGSSYDCFQSKNIKWISCYKLLVDMVETPVDYCNSGFTLHNDKLYVESLGDIRQFAYSVMSETRLQPLIEDKELPPEVLYLLACDELESHCGNHYSNIFIDSEKGATWDIEYEEYEVQYDNEPEPTKQYNSHTVILNEERYKELCTWDKLKRAELVANKAYWKELSDSKWFTKATEDSEDSSLEIEEYEDSEY